MVNVILVKPKIKKTESRAYDFVRIVPGKYITGIFGLLNFFSSNKLIFVFHSFISFKE